MEPITTSITTGVIRATSTKVVSTISDFFIKEFSKLWQGRKFSSNNEDLIKSIEKIANVKTLFHGADKPVNLYDFFIVPTLTLKK